MKIERVNNGFLVTTKTMVPREDPNFRLLTQTSMSYRIPCDEHEEKYVFEKWSELQLFIRKHFGVTE